MSILLAITPILYLTIFTCTTAHEFGHALAALCLSRGPVIVATGRPLAVASGGRLTLSIGLGTRGGSCYFGPPSSRRALVLIAAAGPAATLLLGVLAGICFIVVADASLRSLPGLYFACAAAAGTIDAVHNAWPTRNPGAPEPAVDNERPGVIEPSGNDGYVIAREIGWQRYSASAPRPAVIPQRPASLPAAASTAGGLSSRELRLCWVAVGLALFMVPEVALSVAATCGFMWLHARDEEFAACLEGPLTTAGDPAPSHPSRSVAPPG